MNVFGAFLATLILSPLGAYAGITYNIDLGTAGSFAVLAGSTVTNTGISAVFGNLAVTPGTAITGFPPGLLTGTIDENDAIAIEAETDAHTAYNSAVSETATEILTGTDLG